MMPRSSICGHGSIRMHSSRDASDSSAVSQYSVRHRELARNDRPGARQQAAPREVADVGEDADEDDELDRVGRCASAAGPSRARRGSAARSRPPRPIRRSSAARGLRPRSTASRAAAGRTHRAPTPRRRSESTRRRSSCRSRHVPVDDGDDQPGDVQHGKRDHLAPGERVADAAIDRVGTILGEADDVGLRLDAGKAAAQARRCPVPTSTAASQSAIRVSKPLREEIERQRPGRDEEHPNPDRPVRQPVADFVPFPDAPIARQLDSLGVTVLALVGRWK